MSAATTSEASAIEAEAYPSRIYFNEVDSGNHFAAWQERDLLTTEVRLAFGSLRDERRSS